MSDNTTITDDDIMRWAKTLKPISYFVNVPDYIGYLAQARKARKLRSMSVTDGKIEIVFTYDRWQKARDFSHGMNAT